MGSFSSFSNMCYVKIVLNHCQAVFATPVTTARLLEEFQMTRCISLGVVFLQTADSASLAILTPRLQVVRFSQLPKRTINYPLETEFMKRRCMRYLAGCTCRDTMHDAETNEAEILRNVSTRSGHGRSNSCAPCGTKT